MDEEKYIIDIKHIGKKFGNLTVLKDISSKIKKNEVVVIIGPSGSGKSTFLRCLKPLHQELLLLTGCPWMEKSILILYVLR